MIYLELFWSFFQIGLFSVGGGYAAMPIIEHQVVELHGWMTMQEFVDIITISQMTPGPIAVNSATFVGIQIAGLPGAIIATLGCIFPSCIIVLTLAWVYSRYRNLSVVQGVLGGLRPAVVAMIASAGLSILVLSLWNGAAVNYSLPETVCRIACMLCVGFLEEVIFRGFLFVSIAKENVRSAIIISSVTFGVGHLINLFNGSGMELVNNLCQICFAIAVGFLLVTIFYRGGSLLPCIIVHSAINTLGTFANDTDLTMQMNLLHIFALILITVAYTLILTKTLPRKS